MIMQKLINSARSLAESETLDCYYGALYMTLSLVGSCAKKQYPTLNDNKSYQSWIEEYYHPLCRSLHNNMIIPAFTIYKFRCALIHESSLDVIEDKSCAPHEFYLTTQNIHFVVWSGQQTVLNVKAFILELLQAIERWLTTFTAAGHDATCSLEITTGLLSTKPRNGITLLKDCGQID